MKSPNANSRERQIYPAFRQLQSAAHVFATIFISFTERYRTSYIAFASILYYFYITANFVVSDVLQFIIVISAPFEKKVGYWNQCRTYTYARNANPFSYHDCLRRVD